MNELKHIIIQFLDRGGIITSDERAQLETACDASEARIRFLEKSMDALMRRGSPDTSTAKVDIRTLQKQIADLQEILEEIQWTDYERDHPVTDSWQ